MNSKYIIPDFTLINLSTHPSQYVRDILIMLNPIMYNNSTTIIVTELEVEVFYNTRRIGLVQLEDLETAYIAWTQGKAG